MLLVVPILTLALMTAAWARRFGWRDGLLLAFLCLALLWWSTAAVLSPFEAFATPGILAHYGIASLVSVVVLARGGLPHRPPLTALRDPWVVTLAVTTLVLLVLALSTAPNNVDSLFYHLPKMEQWIQNREVGPFRTSYLPQIYLPPLAELGLAHFSVLGGTVWAVNLVQLTSSVVAMVGVSVIARNVGIDVRGQAIAAGLIGLAPIAVSEAVTTQNDYVATALVVVVYAAASRSRWSVHPGWILVAAVAAGLALCTKPSGALIAAPACAWSLVHLRHVTRRRGLAVAVAGVAIAGLLNVGWMADNQRIFDSPLGPPAPDIGATKESSLTTHRVTPGIVVGNMVRNAGSVAATHRNGDVNLWMRDGLAASMSAVGIDPDDPEALHGAEEWVVVNWMSEDQTGSTLQVLLLLGGIVYCLASAPTRRRTWPLMACLLAGYVLFCALLRWQPFGTRLLLPALAVGAVIAAAWISRWPRLAQLALIPLLVYQAYPLVTQQPQRPLLGEQSVLVTGPEKELYRYSPGMQTRFEDYAAYLTRVPGAKIGLQEDMKLLEYPIWYELKAADPTVEIGYIDGVGPGRPPGYFDVSLAWYEMIAYERPEDWAAAGYATK